MTVSIVVPVLDEAATITGLLDHLTALVPDAEIVVVDGGSTDGTPELAAGRARVVRVGGGRGPQLAAGVEAATGDVLWFVHADTRLDPRAPAALRAALADPAVAAGGFRLRFDRDTPTLRWLAWTSNVRARRTGWIFGDQAMFVRRGVLTALGGVPAIPLMEDLELSRRLRRGGHRTVLLDPPSTASSRRFDEHGTVAMIVRMQLLKLAYLRGVPPEELRRRYTARSRWRTALDRTRPVDPGFTAALRRRWAELPEIARTPGQILGRHGVGCEGTHGVFPRCNLACTPCYHSRDANQVRVDGAHTLAEVEAQMALLREVRGPSAHAQLIGGEVTLLDPDDHAAALEIMRRHGREPMSMTHGDVDPDHLRRLAVDPDGRRRTRRLSFSVHVDSLMVGRRGHTRPDDEASLHPARARFLAMTERLRRETGVRSFVAHSMTVSPANLGQVAEVVRGTWAMRFGMLSFQPAAFLGDDRRWKEDYREQTVDDVWAEVERGVGTRLDHSVLQNGDTRCNRTAYGLRVGERWVAVFDADDPRDLAARDEMFAAFGPVSFTGQPGWVVAGRVARRLAPRPRTIGTALTWARRFVRRSGGAVHLAREALGGRVGPRTLVVHAFMDAADVAPAWAATQRGEWSDDSRVRGTQERLAACHYAMAHPENGTLVPACVQHALLDPHENAQLKLMMPRVRPRESAD